MSLGQDIFLGALESLFKFTREARERRFLSRATPDQLAEWRSQTFEKIRKDAEKLATLNDDDWLRKRNMERRNLVRGYEVLMRNDLGLKMSQYLLEGMDIRGLDLRKMRGLDQRQIDRAIGDATTELPDYLESPTAWSTP